MLTFAVESFFWMERELKGLIVEHWQEVTSNPDTMPIDPAWETYRELDSIGRLFCLSARNERKELVGYVIHLVYPALHYKNILMASDDAHFLKKEYRKGSAALRMFRAVEGELKKMGVGVVTYHSKTRPDINKRPVFERLGYAGHEVIFMKRLEEN